jgi:transposase
MILPNGFKIWLSNTPTDMRKAINGLSLLVVEQFNNSPQTGELFVFYNRRRDRIKILYWHYNGFCIFHKRLEKASFKIPDKLETAMTLTEHQINRLIEGLHFSNDLKNSYDVFY